MNNEIAVIISNEKIAQAMREIIDGLEYHYPVCVCDVDAALGNAKMYIDKGTKIIISLGITAQLLRTHISVMVIELQYSGLEFAAAINEGLKINDKVAVIGSRGMLHLIGHAQGMTKGKQQVDFFEISLLESVEDQVNKIIDRGYEVIIGGSHPVRAAHKRNKAGISPAVDKRLLAYILDTTRYMLELIKETDEKSQHIETLLKCTSEAIIGLDLNKQITFSNYTASQLFHKPSELLLGMPYQVMLEEAQLTDISYGTTGSVIADTTPIIVDSVVTGYVCVIKKVTEIQNLELKIRKELLSKGLFAKSSFRDIIGDSKNMQECIHMAKTYAKFDSSVMITGESGTGKEIFAQSIHNESKRKEEAFVAVNCAAIPEQLLESELFGYVKGAFTGARREGREGFFERAHNGTIFLDEIGEIPISMQTRLLRVLQEGELQKIGDDKVIPINVRILCATNKILHEQVEKGLFREDLFFRLCVLELHLPPLRKRVEDIKHLSQAALLNLNRRLGTKVRYIDDSLIQILEKMKWMGNIRQLFNTIERMLILCESDSLSADLYYQLYGHDEVQPTIVQSSKSPLTMRELEQQYILEILQQNNGNKKETARVLGIGTATLWRKLNEIT